MKGIPEEGMPQFRHPEVKGNLYVHFDVQFPENAFLEEKDLKVSYAWLLSLGDHLEPCLTDTPEKRTPMI